MVHLIHDTKFIFLADLVSHCTEKKLFWGANFLICPKKVIPNCDFFAIWYHFLAKTAPFSKNDPCLAKIRLVLPHLGESCAKQQQ